MATTGDSFVYNSRRNNVDEPNGNVLTTNSQENWWRKLVVICKFLFVVGLSILWFPRSHHRIIEISGSCDAHDWD